MNLMAETKVSNILFSVDYPYESIAELREWFETIPISAETRKDIGYRNAIRLFGLPLDYDT
jgi:gamma-resorcylate decarboxylase